MLDQHHQVVELTDQIPCLQMLTLPENTFKLSFSPRENSKFTYSPHHSQPVRHRPHILQNSSCFAKPTQCYLCTSPIDELQGCKCGHGKFHVECFKKRLNKLHEVELFRCTICGEYLPTDIHRYQVKLLKYLIPIVILGLVQIALIVILSLLWYNMQAYERLVIIVFITVALASLGYAFFAGYQIKVEWRFNQESLQDPFENSKIIVGALRQHRLSMIM